MLTIRAVNPAKYALQLMDVLFSDKEMSSPCYSGSSRTDKPGLDPAKILILEGNDLSIIMIKYI